jgi:hypothetical protein
MFATILAQRIEPQGTARLSRNQSIAKAVCHKKA